jgi:hypothetical protein
LLHIDILHPNARGGSPAKGGKTMRANDPGTGAPVGTEIAA